MSSDKINTLLEKQLKTLGQRVRLDILKSLMISERNLSFSHLQKQILDSNRNNTNLSFHLNALREMELIRSNEQGYSITLLGKKILDNILSIERVLIQEQKSLVIRTSKYSTEIFDTSKIHQYLIREADMNENLAKKIASIVKQRLLQIDIEYLTAPLIREYINAILLEEGLEIYRHRLTRLGVPPYDVQILYDESDYTPDKFLYQLGSEVSEQFLLLSLLPNNLADLYLSGDICLFNLNLWALKPLGLTITRDTLYKTHNFSNISDSNFHFSQIINFLSNWFSEDLLLSNLMYDNKDMKDFNHLFQVINSYHQESKQNNLQEGLKVSLDLDIHRFLTSMDDSSIKPILSTNHNNKPIEHNYYPLISLNYPTLSIEILKKLPKLFGFNNYDHFRFYNSAQNLVNSLIIAPFYNSQSPDNRLILDKIIINLQNIAQEANQDDAKFMELLASRINSVFSLFQYKKKFIHKRFAQNRTCINRLSKIFNGKIEDWLDESIKALSFIGLNGSVKLHCGIELDRLDSSMGFSLQILKYMKNLVDELNYDLNENLILSQSCFNSFDQFKKCNDHYLNRNISSNIIREDAQLNTEEKLDLFTQITPYIKGGSLFTMHSQQNNDSSFEETINALYNLKIPAFRIK